MATKRRNVVKIAPTGLKQLSITIFFVYNDSLLSSQIQQNYPVYKPVHHQAQIYKSPPPAPKQQQQVYASPVQPQAQPPLLQQQQPMQHFMRSPPVQYRPSVQAQSSSTFNASSSPSTTFLPHPMGLSTRVYPTQQAQLVHFTQAPPKPVPNNAIYTPPPPPPSTTPQTPPMRALLQSNDHHYYKVESREPPPPPLIAPAPPPHVPPPSPLSSALSEVSKKEAKLRPERVTDPSIQELKCVHGGNYRYSISKQSFGRVRCPFCYNVEMSNVDVTKRKLDTTMIRAEYWRRHMTEVHNKDNQREQTHNLKLCLSCFKRGQEDSKVAKEQKQKLPDFDAVFLTPREMDEHARFMHQCKIEFGSIWEKKEQPEKKTSKPKKEKKKEAIKMEATESPVATPPPPPPLILPPPTTKPVVMEPKVVVQSKQEPTHSSPLLASLPVSEAISGSSGLLISPFNDQTFNFHTSLLAPETLNTDCSFNEIMTDSIDCNYDNNEISQVLESATVVPATTKSVEQGGSDEQRKSNKKEEISKIKCDKNESYLWNPRGYYEKTICPLCPDKSEHKFKELTTPHFRKHLEQVHTLQEILSVMVCRLCHRHGVQNRVDMFLGLVAEKDTQRHREQAHPNQMTEFIQVYAKRNKQNKPDAKQDGWGLEGGIKKDPNKVYKYASRPKSKPKSKQQVDSNKTNKPTEQQSTEQQQQATQIQPHKAQPIANMVPQHPIQQPFLQSAPVQPTPPPPPQRHSRPLIAQSTVGPIASMQSHLHAPIAEHQPPQTHQPHHAQSLVNPGMQQPQQQHIPITTKQSIRPMLQLHQPQRQQQQQLQQPMQQHSHVQTTPLQHYRVPMPVITSPAAAPQPPPTAAYPFEHFPPSITTSSTSSPSPACPVVRAHPP